MLRRPSSKKKESLKATGSSPTEARRLLPSSTHSKKNSFDDWSKFPHRTRESLIEHGKSIAAPLNKYYTDLFLKEDGDCYNRGYDRGPYLYDVQWGLG
jgi:hypothetical protein